MRILAYFWAAPTTLIGLIFVAVTRLTGGKAKIVRGVVEAHGGCATFFLKRCVPLAGGAAALTLGHVVLGVDAATLDHTRTHERVHVRQCERWGPFFLPAYFLVSLYLLVRRRDAYRDNPFEREAYDHESAVVGGRSMD